MKFGVLVFPGSNCDQDCVDVLRDVLQQQVVPLWHQETTLRGCEAVVLPGGFSYGDYLRTGAVARFSPVMRAVASFAKDGGLVIGICNGFQILLESGILPGAMLRNTGLRFICKFVTLRVERTDTPFTNQFQEGQVIRLPIAHNEGRYVVDAPSTRTTASPRLRSGQAGRGLVPRLRSALVPSEATSRVEGLAQDSAPRASAGLQKTLRQIEGQVAFRYCDDDGRVTDAANPNGSLDAIAGITNGAGNVLGMMPHPERASEDALGSSDGRLVFESMMAAYAHA